jgi:hypothetical protein
MRHALWIALLILATGSRCDSPRPLPEGPPPDPKPGEYVHMRGRLDEDVDCRLLHTESGTVYSLSDPLRNYRNGTRLCIYGTVAGVSQCMHTPSIDVDQIRSWSSCRP